MDGDEPLPCEGCINDDPNQLAHCDVGGCLYLEDEVEKN